MTWWWYYRYFQLALLHFPLSPELDHNSTTLCMPICRTPSTFPSPSPTLMNADWFFAREKRTHARLDKKRSKTYTIYQRACVHADAVVSLLIPPHTPCIACPIREPADTRSHVRHGAAMHMPPMPQMRGRMPSKSNARTWWYMVVAVPALGF
jgi:hypothetical protein